MSCFKIQNTHSSLFCPRALAYKLWWRQQVRRATTKWTSPTSPAAQRRSRSAQSSATAWWSPSTPTTWWPPGARRSTWRCSRRWTRGTSSTRSTCSCRRASSGPGRTPSSCCSPRSHFTNGQREHLIIRLPHKNH